jgi:hypothetical protein
VIPQNELKKLTRKIQREDARIFKSGGTRPTVESIFQSDGPALSPDLGLSPLECEFVERVGRPMLAALEEEEPSRAPNAVDAALEFLEVAQPSHWICAFKMRALRSLKRIPFSHEQKQRMQMLAPQLWNDYPSAHCKEVNVELRRALAVVADAAFVGTLHEWSRRKDELVQRESRRVLEILAHQRPDLS